MSRERCKNQKCLVPLNHIERALNRRYCISCRHMGKRGMFWGGIIGGILLTLIKFIAAQVH